MGPRGNFNFGISNSLSSAFLKKAKKIFIEIKPEFKLKKPVPPATSAPLKEIRKSNRAAKEYLINEAKYAAIKEWAERHNSKFYVFTEKTLERILGRFWHENK